VPTTVIKNLEVLCAWVRSIEAAGGRDRDGRLLVARAIAAPWDQCAGRSKCDAAILRSGFLSGPAGELHLPGCPGRA
jgi:hypothetical protein